MSGNYVICKYKSEPHGCVLGDLAGLEDDYRLNDGTPLAEGFPTDVAFHMHPDYPNDILLTDSLLNSNLLIVGHQRLADFLKQRNIPELEFLPVGIIDHKGRKSAENYFVIHPTHPIDCLDKANSIFSNSFILPENISSIDRLALDESRIPKDRQVFRLKGFWNIALFRRDLAADLDREGFSGLGWLEISDYPET